MCCSAAFDEGGGGTKGGGGAAAGAAGLADKDDRVSGGKASPPEPQGNATKSSEPDLEDSEARLHLAGWGEERP